MEFMADSILFSEINDEKYSTVILFSLSHLYISISSRLHELNAVL